MGPKGTWHLARILRIDLYLHWSWFLVVLLEFQDRAHAYSNPVWNLLEIVALFAIITLHEFGHALATRQVGGHADRILLWPFGGIAYVDPPVRPGATLWAICAGPLVNVALAPFFYELLHVPMPSLDAAVFVNYLFWMNLALLIFNILPIYPLDGGQILRSLLWFPLGRAKSLLATTALGLIGVVGLLYLSWQLGDLWLAAITVFILIYCWKGLRSGQVLWKLSQLPHHEGWACPWCKAAPVAAPLWRCSGCGNGYDIFAHGGICPNCHVRVKNAQCPECVHAYPLEAWARPAVTSPIPAGQRGY
ncbi:MAG: site-2 protease family protein [Terriglobales bacterium]